MRIAWCTPFSRSSAIGAVSRAVAEELARTCDVEIFHPATTDPIPTTVFTNPLFNGEAATEVLDGFDLVFYCMGNHLRNHKAILDAAQRIPGIVVLHDLVLHHFFVDHCHHQYGGEQRYLREIGRLYGADERERARVTLESTPPDRWQPVHPERTPMFELFIAGAMGVVTHSQYARDQVRERFLGPVTAIPLPVVRDAVPPVGTAAHNGGKVVVATIGQINPNKLVGAVIQAIGADASLRGRVHYLVVGPCADAHRRELEEIVAALGLADVVELRGRVTDAELTEVLVRADVCVNLRNPCLEAASASLGEAMWFGKPVIVTHAGCYSELPDDCVVKTDPEEPVASVAAALRRLIDDPALRTAFGERASAYAQANLRADRYASSLLPFIEEVMAARPFLAVADRFGENMARLGISGDMPVVDVTAALTHELFAGAAPSAAGVTGPAGVRVEPSG